MRDASILRETIIVLGGDGYYGWPVALKLAVTRPETKIIIADNEWRRNTVRSIGSDSLLPIARLPERIAAFKEIYQQDNLHFVKMDVNSEALEELIKTERPHTIYHMAQQCSAPYSMLGLNESLYTINNNEGGHMRLLWAVRKHIPQAHIIKLGSMGEYAYGGIDIAEGYFYPEFNGKKAAKPVPYPRAADDVYHISKINDSNYLAMACRKWGLRITEIMQSTLFGNYIDEMANCEALYTRYDYDDIFGTVVNRFLTQAISGHPLTVYGKGNQVTGIMPLRDAVSSIVTLADGQLTEKGEHRVINHVTKANCAINELAQYVKELAEGQGYEVTINRVFDPRNEQNINKFDIEVLSDHIDNNATVTPFADALAETFNLINRYKDRIHASVFTHHIGTGVSINDKPADIPAAAEALITDESYWKEFRERYFRTARINLNPATLGTASQQVKAVRQDAAIAYNLEGNPLGMYENGRRKIGEIKSICAELWPSEGYELMVANGMSQTINLLALTMLRKLNQEGITKCKVVTSMHEHPGGIGVFEQLPECEVHYIADEIMRDERRLARVINDIQPNIAFISHVYYSNGNFAPLIRWCNAVRKTTPNCKLILDVTQSIGIHDLPFGAADVVTGSAHKWLFGPHGSGLTWMKHEFTEWLGGIYWNGNGLMLNKHDDKFCLQGGHDFLMYSELAEALKLYRQVGKDVAFQRSAHLSNIFRNKIGALLSQYNISYRVLNESTDAPLLSVAMYDYNPYALYSYLNENGIHCKCLIDHKDGDGTCHILRFGLPYYETIDRLDQVIDEMQRPLKVSQNEYISLSKLATAIVAA
jgi:UDP-sulfoquinovose synthase